MINERNYYVERDQKKKKKWCRNVSENHFGLIFNKTKNFALRTTIIQVLENISKFTAHFYNVIKSN